MELTTVADDHAVVHDGLAVRRYDDLEPDTVYEFDGFAFRTLARPAGERLATFATVNDVHFGEVECGIMDGIDLGPTFSVTDGEEPYPETMNRGAIHEIELLDPDLVLVKGDLTAEGTDEEYRDFLEFYGEAFGDRLVHTRGNHDVHGARRLRVRAHPAGRPAGCGPRRARHLGPGPGRRPRRPGSSSSGCTTSPPTPTGRSTCSGTTTSGARTPCAAFGATFGIDAASSVRLVEVVAARHNIRGYFAGHTHRNRVRHISISRDVPWVEVACVKDFPGAWAEYRVYEGGLLQVFHRISTPDALVWIREDPGHVRRDVLRLQLR